MKIYKEPTEAPAIADPLVIDAAELHAMRVYAESRGVTLWFHYRWKKTGERKPNARGYVRDSIKRFRKILAEAAPGPEPILRLEGWQIESTYANYSELESAELARRLRMQGALRKLLSCSDPRWRAVEDNNNRLMQQAATRFAGLFAPVVLDLAA